jgi:D-glycero-D-manno-heptose 1,7-bisphosphate phosphatase
LKLVILDRDGVINHDSENYIKTPDEWMAINKSPEAIAALSQAGFTVVIASNQSGIGRGLFDGEMLAHIHAKLIDTVEAAGGKIDGIFFCPHHPDEKCACRKPKPGLINAIEHEFEISAKKIGAYFVGDTLKDIELANNTGCHPILVKTGKGLETLKHDVGLENVPVVDDLWQASQFILGKRL